MCVYGKGTKGTKEKGTRDSHSTYLFQNLLLALVVPARAHHEVEVPLLSSVRTLFGLERPETGIDVALVAEPPPEEPADALHVAVEVPETVPGTRRNLAR